jgi:hypothetical protein
MDRNQGDVETTALAFAGKLRLLGKMTTDQIGRGWASLSHDFKAVIWNDNTFLDTGLDWIESRITGNCPRSVIPFQ